MGDKQKAWKGRGIDGEREDDTAERRGD